MVTSAITKTFMLVNTNAWIVLLVSGLVRINIIFSFSVLTGKTLVCFIAKNKYFIT